MKKKQHTVAKKAKAVAVDNMIEEAELIIGLPRMKDSFDKDELPINFILKRGRDRAEAVATKRTQPAASARHPKKRKK